jgi:hypothetical protein
VDVAREFLRTNRSVEIRPSSDPKRKWPVKELAALGGIAVLVLFVVLVSTQGSGHVPTDSRCPTSQSTHVVSTGGRVPQGLKPNTLYAATVVTTSGTFQIALNPLGSIKALNNFVVLSKQGAYTCDAFATSSNHLVRVGRPPGIRNSSAYRLDTGDPTATTTPGSVPPGSVALALNGIEWVVVLGPQGASLPDDVLLGHVYSGLKVVDEVAAKGRILSVNILERSLP